ncbi:hypothetical protein MTR67_022938 [Solanum verrucosum]|uniref:Replication protein A 70 kDa DNA-binding subunit B/D first OB fold domain-containing protein n=1 Tax=Solanum verrucosum TaxID=315347 RepID=A0AAF0QW79_SOLVR|nr:hypothetical protein MTR67_022938 [Solanum verrucosum]
MILQDEKGDSIHASLGKTLIKHFREILYELGVFRMNYFVIAPNIMKFKTTTHKHKLNFTVTTNVKEIQDPSFHMDIFNIRTFDKLTIHHNVDETELLDVVGHVSSYQPIQQIKQGDNNSYFINIVLEMIKNYSVRSCWYQTKIWINPNLPQPTEFKDRNLPFGLLQKSSVWNLTMDGHTWLATIVLQRLIQREPNIIVKNAILKLNLLFTVLNFTDDDTLLKEFCHPDLQDSRNKSLFECEQSYDEDKLFETPIKSSISECATLITEDVIDLTTKISTKSSKAAGNLQGMKFKTI